MCILVDYYIPLSPPLLSTQLLSTSHHQVTTHNCRGNLVSAVSYTECVLVLFQTSINFRYFFSVYFSSHQTSDLV